MQSLVQSNDCFGAISVGNLKNRSLDGELLVAREKRTTVEFCVFNTIGYRDTCVFFFFSQLTHITFLFV